MGVKINEPVCPVQLVSSLSSLGDLSFSSSSKASDGYGLSPSLGSGLMKSKSDHRLAAQFRDQEDTYGYSGRTSPLMRRRFGERPVERYSLSRLLPPPLTPSQHSGPTNTLLPALGGAAASHSLGPGHATHSTRPCSDNGAMLLNHDACVTKSCLLWIIPGHSTLLGQRVAGIVYILCCLWPAAHCKNLIN